MDLKNIEKRFKKLYKQTSKVNATNRNIKVI